MAQETPNVDVFSKRRSRAAVLSLALAFALVLIITLIGEAFAPGAADRRPGHNSWSYGARGFRALYEVLEALGYRVERHRRTYRALPPPQDSVLLSLDPGSLQTLIQESTPAESEDSTRLLREWVEAGGRLIITRPGHWMLNYRGFEITLQGGDVEDDIENDVEDDVERGGGAGATAGDSADAGETDSLTRRERSTLLDDLLEDVPDVVAHPLADTLRTRLPLGEFASEIPDLTRGQARALEAYLSSTGSADGMDGTDSTGSASVDLFAGVPAGATTLVTIGDRALALEYEIGEGRVVCFSTAFPFANGALKWTPAAEVVAELIEHISEGGRRRLYFDELTHGYPERSGLLRWARETALYYPLMTVLIGIVLGGWYGAIRFGPPRPERGAPRRAREEFVLSLGDMYRRGGHYDHALALIVEAYEAHLAQLLGSSGGAIGHGADGVPATARFSYRVPATEREFLKVARSLHAEYLTLVDMVRGRKSPRGESR